MCGGGGLDKFMLKEIRSPILFSKSTVCHFIQMKRLPGAAGAHRREPGAGGEERELVTGPLACA